MDNGYLLGNKEINSKVVNNIYFLVVK